jgi:hypothetical protein
MEVARGSLKLPTFIKRFSVFAIGAFAARFSFERTSIAFITPFIATITAPLVVDFIEIFGGIDL